VFNRRDGGTIKCVAVRMQNLNVCRNAVGANHHGHHGHALYIFIGYVPRIRRDYGANQFGCGNLRARVVDAVLVGNLMNLVAQ
jgi:hypothetical protein